MEETRTVGGSWDVSTYRYRIEGRGIGIMLDGLKEGKFRGIKCGKCGTVYLPGAFYCRKCHIEIDEVVGMSDCGEVVSYTAVMSDVRGNPLDEPFVSGMIKLDGCDSWFLGVIKGIDWEDVSVGMRVKAAWKPPEERVGSFQDVAFFEPE